MSNVRSIAYLLALLLPTLCASGCKNSSSGNVPVHGKVIYRGAPIDKASITFFPGIGRAIPTTVANGEYATELPPGDYVAVVDVANELPPGFKEGEAVPPSKAVLPEQYTNRAKSTLKATIVAGQDQPIDFDLK